GGVHARRELEAVLERTVHSLVQQRGYLHGFPRREGGIEDDGVAAAERLRLGLRGTGESEEGENDSERESTHEGSSLNKGMCEGIAMRA
ncbi:MAG TPA: hypothetical protein VF266_00950, partial [Thermoanaerobaculia bacterium]